MQATGFLEELAAIRTRTHALLALVPDDEGFLWQQAPARMPAVAAEQVSAGQRG